jgi:hypothetical protein
VPRIAALGHEVIISGPFSFAGSPMGWGGFTVLPGAQDPFGSDVIGGHYRRNQCDLMITLCDVFMMDTDAMKGLNVVHWLPVDCSPMGATDTEKARKAAAVIAMSRFGEQEMIKKGFAPFYVPHGVDTTVFAPPADKAKLREELGFDPAAFLIGLNAANKQGPRKGIQEQLYAFADFRSRHAEARLLVHSFAQPSQGGVNIKKLAEFLGISDAIMLPDQYAYACGLMEQPMMAKWYGLLDVLSNCSYGEGFGLPVIEAQSCGVPVVVTNASTMPELCGAGWKVASEPFWVEGHDSEWRRPCIPGIAGAYEAAWQLWQAGDAGAEAGGETVTWAETQARAREFALQYDADLILEQCWKPVLDQLDEQRPKTRRMTAVQRAELPEPEPGERDLILLVPTRGRPGNAARLIQAVRETRTMATDIVFGVDGDDPELAAYEQVFAEARRGYKDSPYHPMIWFHVNDRMSLAGWTNWLAETYAHRYRYLGSLGDDHCPQTKGWDGELIRVLDAEGPGYAYPNDYVREDIPQLVVVSSSIVLALGWMCEPSISHFFTDNVWSDLGQFAGCIWFLPDVDVEHMHHLNRRHPGEVERDQTYREAEQSFPADLAAFEQWRAGRAQDDVAKIRALREPPQPAAP